MKQKVNPTTLVPFQVQGPTGDMVDCFKDDQGRLLFSAALIGKMLELKKGQYSINTMFRNHEDEFEEGITHISDLGPSGGPKSKGRPTQRYYYVEGVAQFTFYSEGPVAKAVRKWTRKLMVSVWTTGKYVHPALEAQESGNQQLVTAVIGLVENCKQSNEHAIRIHEQFAKQLKANEKRQAKSDELNRQILIALGDKSIYPYPEYQTGNERARFLLGKKCPDKFGSGPHFENQLGTQHKIKFGIWPARRNNYPGRVNKNGVFVYPNKPEIMEFIKKEAREWVRLHHPNQKCLKLK
jgi:prophage antirepressor-like protein